MRFDKPVRFVKRDTVYNYDTGNHDAVDDVVVEVYANVTNQSEKRMALAYGAIKEDSLTVRLQNHYQEPFDHLLIDGQKYRMDSQRLHRRYHVLWVSAL